MAERSCGSAAGGIVDIRSPNSARPQSPGTLRSKTSPSRVRSILLPLGFRARERRPFLRRLFAIASHQVVGTERAGLDAARHTLAASGAFAFFRYLSHTCPLLGWPPSQPRMPCSYHTAWPAAPPQLLKHRTFAMLEAFVCSSYERLPSRFPRDAQ